MVAYRGVNLMGLLVQTYLQRNKGKATNEIWHQHLVQRDSSSMYLPPSSSSTIFSRFAPTLLITTNLFDKLSILFLFCVTSSNDRKKTCFILNNAIVLKGVYVFYMYLYSATLLDIVLCEKGSCRSRIAENSVIVL